MQLLYCRTQDKDCRFKPDSIGATCTGYTDIPEGDEDALQDAVASIGPVSVAIDAGHSSFQLYETGEIRPLPGSQTVGLGPICGSQTNFYLWVTSQVKIPT